MTTSPDVQVRDAAGKSGASGRLAIRDATPGDMGAVQRIYAHHVENGTATFEEAAPSVQEMRARLDHITSQGLPYLVAEQDGVIAGYCYAGQYRQRVAYRYTLENSIYLDPDQAGKGVGKALLAALIRRCEQGPWRQMVAVIAGQDNKASVALHRSAGFSHVGIQPATGYKFGQWIDVVFMQRALGDGAGTQPEPWMPPQA